MVFKEIFKIKSKEEKAAAKAEVDPGVKAMSQQIEERLKSDVSLEKKIKELKIETILGEDQDDSEWLSEEELKQSILDKAGLVDYFANQIRRDFWGKKSEKTQATFDRTIEKIFTKQLDKFLQDGEKVAARKEKLGRERIKFEHELKEKKIKQEGLGKGIAGCYRDLDLSKEIAGSHEEEDKLRSRIEEIEKKYDEKDREITQAESQAENLDIIHQSNIDDLKRELNFNDKQDELRQPLENKVKVFTIYYNQWNDQKQEVVELKKEYIAQMEEVRKLIDETGGKDKYSRARRKEDSKRLAEVQATLNALIGVENKLTERLQQINSKKIEVENMLLKVNRAGKTKAELRQESDVHIEALKAKYAAGQKKSGDILAQDQGTQAGADQKKKEQAEKPELRAAEWIKKIPEMLNLKLNGWQSNAIKNYFSQKGMFMPGQYMDSEQAENNMVNFLVNEVDEYKNKNKSVVREQVIEAIDKI